MFARQRHERILDVVRSEGAVRVSALIDLLGVSDMTVRRDLEALATRGLVSRVHGGATGVIAASTYEPGFTAKSALHRAEKLAIARAAVALVEPGSAVALSAGTTTYALARELCSVPDLTVVTNSVPAYQLLHDTGRADLTVVLTGGVGTPSDALVGPLAAVALRALHTDWLFLGVHGIDQDAGLTTPNLAEAETDRALVASARRLVVVADSTKWGVVGLSTVATLDRIDVLVTDSGLGGCARSVLDAEVGRLVVACPVGGTGRPGVRAGQVRAISGSSQSDAADGLG